MARLRFLSALVLLTLILAACGATPAAPGAATSAAPDSAASAEAAPSEAAPSEAAPSEAAASTETTASEPAASEAAASEAAASGAAASAGASPTPEPLIAGPLKDVPREQTLVLGWSAGPLGITNPWAAPGYTHQDANALLWEPLAYYAIYADEEIPWLAESMTYNDDFTELTITMRDGAKWSDGTPVSAADVVYTFEGQLSNNKLAYHAQFDQFVDTIESPDDKTVVVGFKTPAPRFAFEVLTLKFDTGISIVPKHVLEQQEDVNAYTGGIDMPHSGPYSVVSWDQNQKYLDLREDWWAVEAGLIETPAVKRVIMVNIGGQVGQNMDIVAQRVVNNEFDAALGMTAAVIGNILEQNDKITTHSGSEPPYGYLDWWPNSLWVNTQQAPFDDVNVRRALSMAIDRDTLNSVVFEDAKIATIYPFPLYPGLQEFADSPEVKALEEKYQPQLFDTEQSAALMTEAGFTLNGDNMWEKDGATVPAVINGFEGIHSDVVPILVEMLRNAGFDASVNFGTDAGQNMADGKPGLYMFGHGASLLDPYAVFELYHSRFSAPAGTPAPGGRWSRYENPEYDAIVDAMAPLPSDDPKFKELAVQAMEIYWRDQIDIPVIQFLHRIPYNQTYWTNWPTTDNPGLGINGAFWHHTGMLVVTGLKPAQ